MDQAHAINDSEYTSYALSQAAWDFRCRQLLEFRARFGHTHVPDNWKTNQDLPKWICEVRRLYRLGRLDREKILQALTIKLDLESSEISEEPILKVAVSSLSHRRVRNFWSNSEMRATDQMHTPSSTELCELQTESLVKSLEIVHSSIPNPLVNEVPQITSSSPKAKRILPFDPDATLDSHADSWVEDPDSSDHLLGYGFVLPQTILSAPSSPVSHRSGSRDPIGEILSSHCSLPPPSPKRHAGLISTAPLSSSFSSSSSRLSLRNSEPNNNNNSDQISAANSSSSSNSGGCGSITYEIGGFGVTRASHSSASTGSLSSSAGDSSSQRKKTRTSASASGSSSSSSLPSSSSAATSALLPFTQVGNIRVFTINPEKENTAPAPHPPPPPIAAVLPSRTPQQQQQVTSVTAPPPPPQQRRPIAPAPTQHQAAQPNNIKPSSEIASAFPNMHPAQYLQMYISQQPPAMQQQLLYQILAGQLPHNLAASVAAAASANAAVQQQLPQMLATVPKRSARRSRSESNPSASHSRSSSSSSSASRSSSASHHHHHQQQSNDNNYNTTNATNSNSITNSSLNRSGGYPPVKIAPQPPAAPRYDSAAFTSRYIQLVDFKRENGHLDVPADSALGVWLSEVRNADVLSAEQQRLLQSVGLWQNTPPNENSAPPQQQQQITPSVLLSPPAKQQQHHFHHTEHLSALSSSPMAPPTPTTALPPEFPYHESLL